MSSPLRLALLGAGTWPREAHLPALKNLPSLGTLVAVYSRSEKSAAALAETASAQLKRSRLRSFLTASGKAHWTPFSTGLTSTRSSSPFLSSLNRFSFGVHGLPESMLLLKKPIAGDIETADELIKLHREQYEPQGLKWHILENFVHEPTYLAAKDKVAKGDIGKLSFFSYSVCFHVDTSNRFYQTEWRNKPTHAGRFLLDGGELGGGSALTTLNNEYLSPADTLHALITCEDGSVRTFQPSFGSSPTFVPEELRLIGSTGHLSVSAATAGARNDTPQEEFHESNGVELAIKCFFEAVEGKTTEEKEQRAGAERARRDVEFVSKCLGSEGRPVQL